MATALRTSATLADKFNPTESNPVNLDDQLTTTAPDTARQTAHRNFRDALRVLFRHSRVFINIFDRNALSEAIAARAFQNPR